MIRRWLERLRAWWHADITRRLVDIDIRLMELRRLEAIGIQLAAMEQRAGMPVEPALITPPAQPREWDCGHTHVSGVIPEAGSSECVNCHQKSYRGEES